MHQGLENVDFHLVDFSGWNRLLSVEEPIYSDITLEVLSTIEVDKSLVGYVRPKAIQLKLFGEPRCLSYTQFVLLMRLYDTNFLTNHRYNMLEINFSLLVIPN